MGFFSRKEKIIDLTQGYAGSRKKVPETKTQSPSGFVDLSSSANSSQESSFGFFGAMANAAKENENLDTDDAEDKKRKLAKRLADMTDRLEEIANKIYHIEQRLEVLEMKNNRIGN